MDETKPVKKDNSKLWIYLSIAFFLALTLVITIIGIIYALQNKGAKNNNTDNVINIQNSTPAITLQPSILPTETVVKSASAIYYVKSNIIYKYDISSAKITTLITLAKAEYVDSLFLINDSKLGVVISNASKITISSYDLNTAQNKVLKTLDTKLISYLVWYGDENKFSYLESFDNKAGDSAYKIVYVDNGKTSESLLDGISPHRGTSYTADSSRALVSPDNTKLLVEPILTKDAQTIENQNIVFIYNTADKTITKITNAKMASWLAITEVLYQDTGTNQLYVMNLSSKAKVAYDKFKLSVAGIFGLHKFNDSLVYWRAGGQVYIYDLKTNSEALLITKATEPTWISSTKMLYRAIATCPPDDIRSLCADDLHIYDMSIRTDVLVDKKVDSYTHVNSTGYAYCEAEGCAL